MNKTAIKNFAVSARITLIEAVKQRAYEYEITENGKNDVSLENVGGRPLTPTEKEQRRQLIGRIKLKGFSQAMEEAAYTWFNRFIALRFMEVNGYLPSRIRVFTDENGSFKPEILSEAMNVDIDGLNREYVLELLDRQDNDELYKYLLITQCNALNVGLPEMFEEIGGWTELLFPNNLLRSDSVIAHMVEDIPEEDWTEQVQIIGWLYQYYNSEPKDKVFADLKKNIKVSAENIPAATQLFTPDWIVRYMVDNSLGRLWLEGHNDSSIRENLKYYLDEAEQEAEVQVQLEKLREEYKNIAPEQIRVIDPCMGSGHILVYAFDVLMQIYTSCGWSERDAAVSIVTKNLYGLDIDKRAYQLAYFAVMMKARQYNRRILNGDISPNLANFQDVSGLETDLLDEPLKSFAEQFVFADTYGSLMEISAHENIDEAVSQFSGSFGLSLSQLNMMMLIYRILSQKYDVVVTNPPYMGSGNMNKLLKDYLEENYVNSKTDFYAAFIERCFNYSQKKGYVSLITPQSWMSLSSFIELRKSIINSHSIINAIILTKQTFESGLQAISFISKYEKIDSLNSCFVEQTAQTFSEKPFQKETSCMYIVNQDGFTATAGVQFIYDASNAMLELMKTKNKIKEYAIAKPGMQTSNNERFLRYWHEVIFFGIGFGLDHQNAKNSSYRWFPYNKGVGYRKWYGNNDYIVNYYHDGEDLKYWLTHNPNDPTTKSWSRNLRNYNYYFKDGITFTAIGQLFSSRLNGKGYLFDTKGPMIFGANLEYICGFTNSCVFSKFNRVLCKQATKSFDSVNEIPLIIENELDILLLVSKNIELSKDDWDSFETSWDFKKHPLI